MASFAVTMKDHTVEYVGEVDAYQQEGTMTTFFRNGDLRQVVDSWSHRVFSVRTAEVLMIRLLDDVTDIDAGARPDTWGRQDDTWVIPTPLRAVTGSS
ncbi:MAG: hypothetical protein AB7W59_14595 [Acidimicrobiia bacterium]